MYYQDGSPGLEPRPPEPACACNIYSQDGKTYLPAPPGVAPGTRAGTTLEEYKRRYGHGPDAEANWRKGGGGTGSTYFTGNITAPSGGSTYTGGGGTYGRSGAQPPNYFQYPTTTPATSGKPPGVLTTPGSGEQQWDATKGVLNRRLGELDNKTYAEQLYESGHQGLNTLYDREHTKRQKRLGDQMSAMGIFDSGSGAKALYELEAELGASQAGDMANLASTADAARNTRYDQSRLTSDSIFDQASGAQTHFENRETGGLRAKANLAAQLGPLFASYSTQSTDKQAEIQEQVIQAIIANGTVDRAAAEQEAADMFRMYGISVNALAPRTATAPKPTTDPYPDGYDS